MANSDDVESSTLRVDANHTPVDLAVAQASMQEQLFTQLQNLEQRTTAVAMHNDQLHAQLLHLKNQQQMVTQQINVNNKKLKQLQLDTNATAARYERCSRSKQYVVREMLLAMGVSSNYVTRALKVYEKNYGKKYNVEVLVEISARLRIKDKATKDNGHRRKAISFIIEKMDWKWTEYAQHRDNSFYACIASEIFGVNQHDTYMQVRRDLNEYIARDPGNEAHFKTITERCDLHFLSRQYQFSQRLVAAAEVFNVRIIVFEESYEDSSKSDDIAPSFCAFSTCIDIPLILLTKIGKTWGVIRTKQDVGHLVHCNMKLSEYREVIDNLPPEEVAVKNVCARWLGRRESVPGDVIQIIVRLLPSFIVRPIGLPELRQRAWNSNEQMKHIRSEVMSHMLPPPPSRRNAFGQFVSKSSQKP